MYKLKNFIPIVFKYLKNIPSGQVSTYKAVAQACGLSNPRHVGWILSQNIDPDKIPCYKVVKSDGLLASGYKFGGIIEQKRRLLMQGSKFIGNKVIIDKM